MSGDRIIVPPMQPGAPRNEAWLRQRQSHEQCHQRRFFLESKACSDLSDVNFAQLVGGVKL